MPPFPFLPSILLLHLLSLSISSHLLSSFPSSPGQLCSFLMEGNLDLLGSRGGGDGGLYSGGGSTTGSLSTVSKEHNSVLLSEASSSYPDESELELGLGLSLSGGAVKSNPGPWGQYARILTASDFPSLVSKSSSSSSSSSVIKVNASSAGTKRTAESVSPPRNGVSQVVGWPPIRVYRMNSLVNQAKSPTLDKNGVAEKTSNDFDKSNYNAKEKGFLKTSLFVKVSMDGFPIGRKVDLNAHSSYKTLAQTLDDMFFGPATRRSNTEENSVVRQATSHSKLLDKSSEFVLTYEDKEGDWMLVGDVPWGMFISLVKRLRIMRTSEANGLDPRFQERSGRQRAKPI